MAKIKAAGSSKKTKRSNLQAIPCLLLVLGAVALLSVLFYALLSNTK